jgi:hypothetical protein
MRGEATSPLAVARRHINERLIGEDLDVKLVLDRAARLDRRKNQARAAVKRAAEEEIMLMLASSSSSPRHRGSIERGVDGGNHRVIGGLSTEMCSDRLQKMIALSDRQRRCRALQQRELLIREREGTRCGHVVFPPLAYMRARRASSAS